MIDKVKKDFPFQWFQIQTGDFFKPTTDLDRPFLYSLQVKQFFIISPLLGFCCYTKVCPHFVLAAVILQTGWADCQRKFNF